MSSADNKSFTPPKHKLMSNSSLSGSARIHEHAPHLPFFSFIGSTLGRGTVIWRIWPAVLFWTLHASTIAALSVRQILQVQLPSVMTTVIGVVIGFVISYRVSSGYDRYWMGRTCWSDVIKNSRALGRLIWFHVPLRLTPKTAEESQFGIEERSNEEKRQVMDEKNTALDLLEGFAVALKHHVRGELGIYYDDLYNLIHPLHEDVSNGQLIASQDLGPWSFRTQLSPEERKWKGPVYFSCSRKGTPSEGGNLPLAVLHCLSEWASTLEDRGCVPGTTLGPLIGCIAALEDSLTALERTLTTPLPFAYSAHIRTIWLYLFFLPFQLVGQFGYFSVPGVAMAAFIYLGFVAAGEEIEQPFGYDKNDLDLDTFCHEIIRSDIDQLRNTGCLNNRVE